MPDTISALISYLKDPDRALRGLAGFAESLLVSYRTRELTQERKAYWTSAFALSELLSLLVRNGFVVAELQFNRQVILRAENTTFGPEQVVETARARAEYAIPPRRTGVDILRRLYFQARTCGAIKASRHRSHK